MFQLSFLNASLLFFAAATILPLLIWLLAKKKPRKVIFSTLRFIKLSQQQEKRRSKLTNILLLIIRMLIILLVALAVARPMFNTNKLKPSPKHPPTAIAIMLDTSYSMDYAQGGKSTLQLAKEAISKINARSNDDDQLVLISSDANWNLLNSQLYAGKIPETLLDKLNISYLPLSLQEMLEAAETKLKESQMPNQEIYLLSDNRTAPETLKTAIPIAAIPLREDNSYENLSISKAGVLPQLVDKRRMQLLQFTLENHGTHDRRDVLVKAVLGDIKLAEKFVSVPAKTSITETIPIELRADGWQSGYLEVLDELQTQDNRAYFAFPFFTKPRIAVVSQSGTLPIILDTMLRVYTGAAPVIISPQNLSLSSIDAYQLFIIHDCGPLSPRMREFFSTLASKEAGVLYTLDATLGSDLKAHLNNVFSLGITDRSQKVLSIDMINKHHYISSLISDKQLKHNQSGDYWQAASQGASILLSAQKVPLAVISGKQSLWLWNLSGSQNPFFVDPAFPVFAFRTFDYLASTNVPETSLQVGETITFDRLKLPQGEIISNRRHLATRPGIYTLEPDSPREQVKAINIDYSDSQARTNPPRGLKTLGKNWETQLFFSRLGHDLWKTLLAIALALVFLELIIVKLEEARSGTSNP